MAQQPNAAKYSYFATWSAEDGEFAVVFIELPGLSGLGKTIPDAIAQLHEAFAGWSEVAAEQNYSLPEPIQKNAPVPLVVIDRSHLAKDPVVTELTSVLPKELRPGQTDAVTSGGDSPTIELPRAA